MSYLARGMYHSRLQRHDSCAWSTPDNDTLTTWLAGGEHSALKTQSTALWRVVEPWRRQRGRVHSDLTRSAAPCTAWHSTTNQQTSLQTHRHTHIHTDRHIIIITSSSSSCSRLTQRLSTLPTMHQSVRADMLSFFTFLLLPFFTVKRLHNYTLQPFSSSTVHFLHTLRTLRNVRRLGFTCGIAPWGNDC